ncbi:MAG: hypothetical protein ACRDPK_13745 [Carbonactinosporaceae bacterium]
MDDRRCGSLARWYSRADATFNTGGCTCSTCAAGLASWVLTHRD